MDIIKENERRFLEKQCQLAAQLTEEELHSLKQEWPMVRPQVTIELTDILRQLLMKYRKIENDQLTGPLCYLQFSYLRSAVLDKTPCYRIDLYDHRWMASNLECSMLWNATFSFSSLYRIRDMLLKNFQLQTCARNYRLDEIILDLADQFHWAALHAICLILPEIIVSEPACGVLKHVKIYGGEYFDRFFLLFGEGEEV